MNLEEAKKYLGKKWQLHPEYEPDENPHHPQIPGLKGIRMVISAWGIEKWKALRAKESVQRYRNL